MAARSSKGMASQAGLAARAASMAVLTWSGVAEAYSATFSECLEGLSCVRDSFDCRVVPLTVRGICTGKVRFMDSIALVSWVRSGESLA